MVKHIKLKYHFIRQVVSKGRLELVNIDGKLNPTNALIKIIISKSFVRHHAKLQILHKKLYDFIDF